MKGKANLWRSVEGTWEILGIVIASLELEIYPNFYKYYVRADFLDKVKNQ